MKKTPFTLAGMLLAISAVTVAATGSLAFSATNGSVRLAEHGADAVVASDTPAASSNIAGQEDAGNPQQLFDIALGLNDRRVTSAAELDAHVAFMGFGKASTPVDMIFYILDANGTIVATAKENVVIQTTGVFDKSFGDVSLPAGHYTLRLHTLYNVTVSDEFDQPFEIVAPSILSRIGIL